MPICGEVAVREPPCTGNQVTEVGCHSSTSQLSPLAGLMGVGCYLFTVRRTEFDKSMKEPYLNPEHSAPGVSVLTAQPFPKPKFPTVSSSKSSLALSHRVLTAVIS